MWNGICFENAFFVNLKIILAVTIYARFNIDSNVWLILSAYFWSDFWMKNIPKNLDNFGIFSQEIAILFKISRQFQYNSKSKGFFDHILTRTCCNWQFTDLLSSIHHYINQHLWRNIHLYPIPFNRYQAFRLLCELLKYEVPY